MGRPRIGGYPRAFARARALSRLAAVYPAEYWALYQSELAALGLDPGRPGRRHGTRSCYTGGCRRPECRAANAAYQRRRKAVA